MPLSAISNRNKTGLVLALLCFATTAWSKYEQEMPAGSVNPPAASINYLAEPPAAVPEEGLPCRYDTEFDLNCQPQEAYPRLARVGDGSD